MSVTIDVTIFDAHNVLDAERCGKQQSIDCSYESSDMGGTAIDLYYCQVE